MALSVCVQGYRKKGGKPLWKVDVPWWKYEDFYRDPRSVYCGANSSYNDREVYLTLAEALECHQRYEPHCLRQFEHMEERLQEIDRCLQSLTRKGWFGREGIVRVLVYEFP